MHTLHMTPASATKEPQALGATPTETGVRFRVWADSAAKVEVVAFSPADAHDSAVRGLDAATGLPHFEEIGSSALDRTKDGYFVGTLANLGPGALYKYRIDGAGPYPDPCSRYQPAGPHGPSLVVDPGAFRWSDAQWRGVAGMQGQVIYEMHIGTFTPEGTFDAAAQQLEELKTLGVTLLELMPVGEFPGRWNWGYDGVDLFAPYHGYGDHDALKRFVDAAHRAGLAVILDVVYNHLGPDGNYLPCFSEHYFTDRYRNDWGKAINFDGPDSGPVREFFVENASYWVREFHLDGLRLDATQSIEDASTPHVLAELSERAREAAQPRSIVFVAENEPQRVECLLASDAGGYGLDSMWNDDYHHSARVALTGTHDGYFHDYRGQPQEFISLVKRGFLYQGQYYEWQKQPRGTSLVDQPASALVCFIQNHDQIGNTLGGNRVQHLTSPGRLRALTALTLLAPQTPMLFMGQEFGASAPFHFFADHKPELNPKVHAGRREFLKQFEAYASEEAQASVEDPAAETTFRSSVLDFSERQTHAAIYRLHQQLLALRRNDPVIARQALQAIDGAVLGDAAFVLRWYGGADGDRLLLVNLRDQLELRPAPEPLLAPPMGQAWRLCFSSDDPSYGGAGSIDPRAERGFRLAAESAVLLQSVTGDS
jgi:maltooligosyltrehalose trehalohydrolase